MLECYVAKLFLNYLISLLIKVLKNSKKNNKLSLNLVVLSFDSMVTK